MFRDHAIIRKTAHIIAGAIDETIAAFNDGRIQDETAITDKMTTKIEDRINGFEIKGIKWEAMTLIPQSQEKKFGADFMGVLKINTPYYQVSKGFLVQAKIENNLNLSVLKRQCEDMLQISPDSFVFLYSKTGVKIVSAIAVLSSNKHPSELYYRTPSIFFELHFESFIGDRKLSVPHISVLEKIRKEYDAQRLLYLEAHAV
jgi:hypothetical protein